MSEIITFPLPTGVNYVIPDVGDENWGQNVTDFLVAIPSGVMPTSGTFSLTGDVSFGPTFGLVSQYFKTATTIPATAGFLRLSKTDLIEWRNNANSANLVLAINGSDQLTFAGTPLTIGGVTSITGTANQILASAATGAVTLSTPQSIAPTSSPTFAALTLSAPLTILNGGTGASSFTAYSVLCGGITSTSPLQSVASIGLSGQFLQSQGAGLLPTWANAAGSGTVNSGTAGHAAYYATSTSAVSDGGTVTVQVGTLKAIGASLQVEIRPGGANAINISASSPAADRIYTLPDRGADDTFAFLGGGAQTFTGSTVFNNAQLGSDLNANSHKVTNLTNGTAASDAAAFGQLSTLVPSGIILMYGGAAAPTGWALCNGSAISRTSFASLFAVIGTTFGSGDGSTTFNLPNMTNNVPVGIGSIAALGGLAGAQTHSISSAEMPSHTHIATSTVTDPAHTHTIKTYGVAGGSAEITTTQSANTGAALNSYPGGGTAAIQTATTGVTVGTTNANTGSGTAMSLIQPVLGLAFIIKL